MPWYFHAAQFAAHHAAVINHASTALNATHFYTVHVFHFYDIEGFAGNFVGVRQWLKRETHFCFEVFVRLDAVARYAINHATQFIELGMQITKLQTFGGTALHVVFGVKIQSPRMAA